MELNRKLLKSTDFMKMFILDTTKKIEEKKNNITFNTFGVSMEKAKPIPVEVDEKYKKMNTRQLLKFYQKNRYRWYDQHTLSEEETNMIKYELSKREHIPNKIEAKKKRQEAAKRKK